MIKSSFDLLGLHDDLCKGAATAEIGSVDRTIVGNIHRPSERLLLAIESESPFRLYHNMLITIWRH